MTDARSSSDDPPRRQRRPRYRGTHPRSFGEKYKEHAPELYPELSERLRQEGRTPAGQHVPVLMDEVLAALRPAPGQRGVDGTLGYGGHAAALLSAVAPGGQLLALDVDPIEQPRTEARLRAAGHEHSALIVVRSSFAGLAGALQQQGWSDGADFVLADLGLSSMQLDDPERGFGVRADGPLDMRMNPAQGESAAQWLERARLDTLATALNDHADEPYAEAIARALVDLRESPAGSPTSTHALAAAVAAALPWNLDDEQRSLSVRRVFQALRIAVNKEFSALDALLLALPSCLVSGGRAAIISFHSGEDRRVKLAFRQGLRDGIYRDVAPDPIRASTRERAENPRSTSAKLRWAVRANSPGSV